MQIKFKQNKSSAIYITSVACPRIKSCESGHDKLTLFGRGEDGPWQLGVRLRGLGGHDDLGAVLRGLQRDRLADAAARPRDVKGLARELPGKGKTSCQNTLD